MTQAEERLPLQSTDTAAQYLFQEIRKFQNLLPSTGGDRDESAKRFLTIAMQVLSQKPDLLRKCGRVSVLNCLIECARLRLDPEGALGHAYLIPYDRECTVQIGYKGFCQLVFRQDVKKVWSDAVFPCDHFRLISGDEPRIHHKITIEADDDRESDLEAIIGAYACIILPSGHSDFEWMNLRSIKKTRGKSSAWKEWPIEMAKIRPLKRLLKRQKTTDTTLNHGMALDDRDGAPRDPKLEIEAEVIEVNTAPTGKDLIPAAVAVDEVQPVVRAGTEESRKEVSARIEKLWYDFHKAKIPELVLEMDRELKDYLDTERTSDAEAWKFADLLARALLVAGARAK